MKILHINTSDKGGAGIAALRLHKAMLQQGLDSCFMSADNKINDNKIYFRFNQKSYSENSYIEKPILGIKNYFF